MAEFGRDAGRVFRGETRTAPSGTRHKVRPGETLAKIADRYNVTVDDLMDLNDLDSPDVLRAGRVLKIGKAPRKPDPDADFAPLADDDSTPAPGSFTRRIAGGQGAEPAPAPDDTTALGYTTHRVEAGENLFRIGLRYGVSAFDLMSANELERPEALKAGTTLRVPQVKGTRTPPSAPAVDEIDQGGDAEIFVTRINEAAARQRGFIWPAKGQVIRSFGNKAQGVTSTGINILLPERTPIMAAESGKVLYASDGLKYYGNLVLIRHKNGLITAYAHGARLLVKRGENVKKGQVIALVGRTGNVDRPQLHFEVRRNARAIDPLKILPRK
jgi:murein DD-endopeptidase MepM/ murein hydrolase activator NlpD